MKKLLLIALSIFTLACNKHQIDFDEEATRCDEDQLHHCSAWRYLSTAEFDELIYDGVDKLEPKIHSGEKVFELGTGVGAVFKSLSKHYNHLTIGGNDLSKNAIEKAKSIFPNQAERFFVADMMVPNSDIPDNYFDHVLSFGALGMYLTKPQMLQAAKEAIRITKPGGSLLFTSFIRPGGKRVGSIIEAVESSFWTDHAHELGIENVKVYPMKYQGDRYQIVFRKKSHH